MDDAALEDFEAKERDVKRGYSGERLCLLENDSAGLFFEVQVWVVVGRRAKGRRRGVAVEN